MARETITVTDLIEDAKRARDRKYDLEALAAHAQEEAIERSTSYNALVSQQAMALGEYMLALSKPMHQSRLLGRKAFGLTHHAGYLDSERHPITPPLMQTEPHDEDGLEVIHGWRFKTRAVAEPRRIGHSWQILSVHIIDHTAVTASETMPIEKEQVIRLQERKPDGKVVPIPYFNISDDPNDPELLDIYALLNMARRELGDKTAN
jgi:hypothetical protein